MPTRSLRTWHRSPLYRSSAPRSTPKLGMDVRRDLLLIFKEAVNNAARHSRLFGRDDRSEA